MSLARKPPAVAPELLTQAIAGFSVVSCDIFDTAIMRRVARPEDMLLAVGARARAAGLTTCPPEAFREYRLEAERAARLAAESAGHDEVRIAEVYAQLHASRVITDAPAGAALEFAGERAACIAVEPVRTALAARDPAQRLVFLSDSMLPGDWLATLLRDCGYGDCTVFCSSDLRRSKHTGRIFPELVQALGCAPADIVHVGDNETSDIARARAAGLAARYLPRPPAPPEPDRVAASPFPVRLLHSHRRSRAAPANGLHRYLSLLLIGFTLFILAEARRRGTNRIVFLARDGHLPLAIARRIVARTGADIDLTYLHVSRQSVVVPTMIDDIPRLADDIGNSMLDRPLRMALQPLGIDTETTERMLRELDLDPEQRLGGAAGMAPIYRLFEARHELIRDRLVQRREAALAYMDQAGFMAPGRRLIVDVGWRGSVQKALARLTGIPLDDIPGAYLGLLPQALGPELNPDTAGGYLFSFGHPASLMETVLDGYILLELFFSAPHGTVLHYVREGDEALPVHAIEQEPGATIRRQAFAALEEDCLREFDAIDNLLDGAWPDTLDPHAALFDLHALLSRPTRREVTDINAIPFIHGIDGSRTVATVNPVGLRQLLLDPNTALRRFRNAPWRSGSIRLCLPWPVPSMTYRELQHRLRWVVK